MNIIVGSHVWVEDHSLAWVDGEVSKLNGEDAEIQTSNGKRVIVLNTLVIYYCLEICKP